MLVGAAMPKWGAPHEAAAEAAAGGTGDGVGGSSAAQTGNPPWTGQQASDRDATPETAAAEAISAWSQLRLLPLLPLLLRPAPPNMTSGR